MGLRKNKSRALPIAMVAAATLIAGCGTSEGTSTESSVAGGVDVGALDTGDYPTAPAQPFGYVTAADDDLGAVDAQRMAEYMVLPFQIDETLTIHSDPTHEVLNDTDLAEVFGEGAQTASLDGAMYGFASAGRAPVSADNQRGFRSVVIRFATSADAKAGAAQLSQFAANDANADIKKQRTALRSLPGGFLVLSGTSSGAVAAATYVPHGDYLIFSEATALNNDSDWVVKTASKGFGEQAKLIDRFPALPTEAENPDPNSRRIKLDQDNILIYALPFSEDTTQVNSLRAVYGPQGIAHFAPNQRELYQLLAQYGSAHNALSKSMVFRASDGNNGQKLYDDLVSNRTEGGASKVDSPKGLPGVACLKSTGENGQHRCLVRVGRYVATVSGSELDDTHRQAAAQYVILTKADQDAK